MKTNEEIKVLKEKIRVARQDRNAKQEEVAALENELHKLQTNTILLT